MIYLLGILGALGGLFQSNPHPGYMKDNIFDEGMPCISKCLAPEIEKIAPGAFIGGGFINMIGYENLKISIYCPSEDNVEIKKASIKAYEAASKGLLKCKRLYNHTNHGLTSPNLVAIKTTTPSGRIAGVHNGEFFYMRGEAQAGWENMDNKGEEFAFFTSLFENLGKCRRVSSYLTCIERDKNAFGLSISVSVEKVPSLEEGIDIFKNKYSELLSWVNKRFPDHFFMLSLDIDNLSARYGVAYHNIRNHVVCFEVTPVGNFNGREYTHYYKPNYLDDLVPAELKREYYK